MDHHGVFHCRPQYAPDARQGYLAARGHGARRPHECWSQVNFGP